MTTPERAWQAGAALGAVDTLPGARRALTRAVQGQLGRLWAGLGSWRDRDAERFVEQAVPIVRAGQRALASRTAATIVDRAQRRTGARVPLVGLTDDEVMDLRTGVRDHDVYRRPFVETYTRLSRGDDFPVALSKGQTRLSEIAELDMQQTYARAAQATLTRLPDGARPSHWRRVLRGETDCSLCTVAATNRYNLAELNPIHPGCDCEVEPEYGDTPNLRDSSRELNLMLREHGEVGPMLVRPDDHFDGPRQVRN